MSFPEELKKELVLSFGFRRIGATWKPDYERPKVMRLANTDCRQEFRDPQVVWRQSCSRAEIRIYDDAGIDITNPPTLLGDVTTAQSRCEQFLRKARHDGRNPKVAADRAA